MRVIYDVRADALSIILTDRPVVESEEKKPGFVLDYDADGDIVSMELLDASRQIE